MHLLRVAIGTLSFVFIASSSAVAQETPEPDPPKLKPVFSDDFSRDTRGQYQIEGDVSWQSGQLKMAEGASITREINGGAWAKVELDFGKAGWAVGDGEAELLIWFLLDAETSCFVSLQRRSRREDEPISSISLVETEKKHRKPVEQVVRDVKLTNKPAHKLIVDYRYGRVLVTANGSEVLLAQLRKASADVRGVSLVSRTGILVIDELKGTSLPKSPLLNQEQRRLAADAISAERQLFSLPKRRVDKAISIGERVFATRKEVFGIVHPDSARILNTLGYLYKSKGDYTKAEQLYLKSQNIRMRIFGKEHGAYAGSLEDLGLLYDSMDEHARAERLFLKASDIRRKVLGEKRNAYAISLNRLGLFYSSRGNYTKAESMYLQALEIRRESLGEDHPDYATSLNNLASLYNNMAEYARAEPLYRQAIAIKKDAVGERHPSYATSLINFARLHESMGDYTRAEELYLEALDIFAGSQGLEHPDFATNLNNLAGLYQEVGEFSRAEPLFIKSLEIRKNLYGQEHRRYATGLNNLALLYMDMGDYGRAESLFLESRDIRKRVDGEEHPNFATSLNNLALVYTSMGDYIRAEPLLLKSRDIRKAVHGKEHSRYATSLNNLARLYHLMEDYDRAESLYLQARALFKKVQGEEHPNFATSLNSLAGLYQELGEYSIAEPLYLQALRSRKKVLGDHHPRYAVSLNNLAGLYESMGAHAQAIPLRWEALSVLASAAGRTIPALSSAQARYWLRNRRPRVDRVLSNLRRQQKRDSSMAYAAVWETKGIASRLRVCGYVPDNASPEVRQVFTKLRDARMKLAAVASTTPSPNQAAGTQQKLAEANERKERLEKELSRLNGGTAREFAVRDAQLDDLMERLPSGVAVIDFIRVANWSRVEREVTFNGKDGESKTLMIREAISTPLYDAFILRADRAASANPGKWVPLGDAEPIESAVKEWRVALTGEDGERGLGKKSGQVGNKPKVVVDSPSEILRKRIWDKLEPHLDGIHTVVLLPDGALNRLPWAALPGRNDGQYLIHDYALIKASTGQQLYGHLIDPPIETPSQLLAVGGIDYDNRAQQPSQIEETPLVASARRALMRSRDDQMWNALPGAAAEADAIVNLWGQRGSVKKLSGAAAKEQSLAQLLPQSRFAHLATHGFFDQAGEVYGNNLREQDLFQTSFSGSKQASVAFRNPLLMTGIVMAGANVPPATDDLGLPVGEDGILTAEELSGLDLRNTELVTLSACETGLGDVAAGDGVYGLTRVLHKSGVRSVVASQWKVDDIATRELMKRFYENLWVKKQSKVNALRNAQLWILNHPDKLTAMGVKNVTRGGVADLPKKADASSQSTKQSQTHPYFWAAFQLSGDWR